MFAGNRHNSEAALIFCLYYFLDLTLGLSSHASYSDIDIRVLLRGYRYAALGCLGSVQDGLSLDEMA